MDNVKGKSIHSFDKIQHGALKRSVKSRIVHVRHIKNKSMEQMLRRSVCEVEETALVIKFNVHALSSNRSLDNKVQLSCLITECKH